MSKDSLGDRMKNYENISRNYLTKRLPVIIRIDGKAFHTFTKGFQKPFDMVLMKTMWETAKYLCANIQGCKLAYTQSDEISLLLTDYEELETQSWFNYNIQKMVSVSSSIATLEFNRVICDKATEYIANIPDTDEGIVELLANTYINAVRKGAMFDSRVFTIPKEEVCNYFIWRQNDATRNSIQMVARANFSHKQLHQKNCNQLQEMLFQEKGINYNDIPTYQKRGTCIVKEDCYMDEIFIRTKWVEDLDIPIFTQEREYIEKYI